MNKNDTRIGNNIISILKKNNISIRKMALDLGWDYSYTYNLAHKDSLVTIQLGTVIKIAEYLGVKIEDLF